MKKMLTLLIWVLGIFTGFAQTEFEPGYYVDNRGNKVEVYIKNFRWLDSPDKVIYKNSSEGDPQSFDVNAVSEFQVEGGPLYKRVTANFPITQQFLSDKSVEPQPDIVSKTVFVKRVLQGPATLYEYRGDNDRIYLIQVGDEDPIPLLYKEYVKRTNDISENNIYRRQLLEWLSCETTTNIQTVDYTSKSLTAYVESYNRCVDPSGEAASREAGEKPKAVTRVLIFGGIVGYDFETVLNFRRVVFESKISPSIGIEVETLLPFNNNKWSAFLSAQFAAYSADGTAEINGLPFKVASLDLNQLIFNFGGRHYMFVGDHSSIFIDLGVVFDYNIKGEFQEEPGFLTPLNDVISTNFGGFGGVGFSWDQKWYISARYFLGASINEDPSDAGNLDRFAVSLRLKL